MSPDPTASLVTYAARLVRVISRATAADSPAGLRILSQLDELGPVTVTDLARADRTSQPTISAAVRGLEERGLVTRIVNPGDGRSMLIGLTDAGRDELDAVRLRHAALLRELVDARDLDLRDVETTVAVLRTLTQADQEPR